MALRLEGLRGGLTLFNAVSSCKGAYMRQQYVSEVTKIQSAYALAGRLLPVLLNRELSKK